ncbi:MAG: type II secretion system F family protein [Candidatus Sungbacteria bacterium]|nr:type II secretion system F family protein [Candidatus Sungbacteria bacterium]
MPIYIYSAAKQNGEVVKGDREAENEKTLAQALKLESLFLLEAKEKKPFSLSSLNVAINLNEITSKFLPISLVERMFFARNLAVMISAGLSLTRAMEALIQESANPKFRRILSDVNNSVIKGTPFADSLRIHEKVFGNLFINMVGAGEASGKLTLVLKLLSNQMKKDYDLRKRVSGAMMYPAVILIALMVIGTLMMIYVVPSLTAVIKDLGVELPLSTRIIIFTSELAADYLLWVLTAFILFVFLFWRALKTKIGKKIFDHITIRLPIFGELIIKFNTARFCRTLAYLITSGVPIVRSLEITGSVLGNSLFQKAVGGAALDIQKGKQLSVLLSAYPRIFHPIVLQMMSVGEETGKTSDMMLRLALFFEEDVTNTTKNLSTIIEPILMIVIGTAVGFFAVSMLQPIYSSLGNVGG